MILLKVKAILNLSLLILHSHLCLCLCLCAVQITKTENKKQNDLLGKKHNEHHLFFENAWIRIIEKCHHYYHHCQRDKYPKQTNKKKYIKQIHCNFIYISIYLYMLWTTIITCDNNEQYGFVNYALELLVLKHFGLDVWEQIK